MSMPTIKTEKIGKRKWMLLESFGPVPAGFVFDGASVPRVLWWFMDPATEAFEASCLHDYFLSQHRNTAHQEFYLALLAYRVPKWRAFAAYSSVTAYHKIKRLFR